MSLFPQLCMIGLVFADEAEAKAMHKKIMNRQKYASGEFQRRHPDQPDELT